MSLLRKLNILGYFSGNGAEVDINGNIKTIGNSQDIFKNNVSVTRYNQIEVHFDSPFDSNVVTNTSSGTGSYSQSNGHAVYSTGVGVTSSVKGVSVSTLIYRSGNELYAYFTASFTTPTNTNSSQKIGVNDSNDGFKIGYNGLNFGIFIKVAGIETFTSVLNGDPLDGSTSSKFRRDNIPEAIDLTNSNIFRIRYGWFGSSPIVFETYSPDGDWVVIHTIKIPNLQVNPSIENPDLPITLEITKSSSDATNLIMTTACWAGGSTSDLQRLNEIITDYSLAKLTRSIIVGKTTGGGGGYVAVKVTPSGALTVESIITSSALPSGASTSSLQTSGNTILSNILTELQLKGDLTETQPVSVQKVSLTANSPTNVTCNSATTALVSSNTSRKGLVITNTGSEDVFIGIGASAEVNKGIYLVAGGGTWAMDEYTFTTQAINGITTTSTSNVSIQEFQ